MYVCIYVPKCICRYKILHTCVQYKKQQNKILNIHYNKMILKLFYEKKNYVIPDKINLN